MGVAGRLGPPARVTPWRKSRDASHPSMHATQDSAVAHYHAFMDMAAGLGATREGLSGVAARLEALAGALPNLAAASERFTAAAQDFSAQRARTKQLHRALCGLLGQDAVSIRPAAVVPGEVKAVQSVCQLLLRALRRRSASAGCLS